MVYIKQDDYDTFFCIADKCPESCCKVWQIVIDDESLEKYSSLQGAIGKRLAGDIDWEEGAFRQRNGVCALLNDRELCDLQLAEGEQALCYTCRMFPRHVEEFEDVRELSLSLACPEVARQELTRKTPVTFLESEDDEADDFEDFDYLLYTKLVDAREKIYELIDSDGVPLDEKMRLILIFSSRLQKCIDNEQLFEMDEVIEAGIPGVSEGEAEENDSDFFDDRNCFAKLFELEFLHRDWRDMIDSAWDCLEGAALYISALSESEERAGVNILKLLIYTYFCGAVYDDMIYSKAALCVYMVRWIYFLCYSMTQGDGVKGSFFSANGVAGGDDCRKETLTKATYQLAREIEHSDLNLDALEEFFDTRIVGA